MVETMTVHEALCRIKVAESKLDKLLSTATFIATKKACEVKVDGKPVEEIEKEIQGDTDKCLAVVNEVNAIKAALNESNAETKIKVCGELMSVASAIYYYRYGVSMMKNVIREMTCQYQEAVNKLAKENGQSLDEKADKYIVANYGSKEKVDPATLREEEDAYKKRHSYEMVDPMSLKKKIDELQFKLDEFTSSVDSAIQVSNATTMITVEY